MDVKAIGGKPAFPQAGEPAPQTKAPAEDVGALISKEASGTQWPPVPADRMLQFFAYAHLPAKLSMVSKPFCDLAEFVVATVPMNPERTVALRKLLEAKDCAVRAMLYK